MLCLMFPVTNMSTLMLHTEPEHLKGCDAISVSFCCLTHHCHGSSVCCSVNANHNNSPEQLVLSIVAAPYVVTLCLWILIMQLQKLDLLTTNQNSDAIFDYHLEFCAWFEVRFLLP
ncbi:hypothetical protein TNCV_2284481 [Trichonephila clavipes]|nr:hypothetical protein TNCV_2284481 [Trichonephila clavipes]